MWLLARNVHVQIVGWSSWKVGTGKVCLFDPAVNLDLLIKCFYHNNKFFTYPKCLWTFPPTCMNAVSWELFCVTVSSVNFWKMFLFIIKLSSFVHLKFTDLSYRSSFPLFITALKEASCFYDNLFPAAYVFSMKHMPLEFWIRKTQPSPRPKSACNMKQVSKWKYCGAVLFQIEWWIISSPIIVTSINKITFPKQNKLFYSRNLHTVILQFLIDWVINMRWHRGQTLLVIHQHGKDKGAHKFNKGEVYWPLKGRRKKKLLTWKCPFIL